MEGCRVHLVMQMQINEATSNDWCDNACFNPCHGLMIRGVNSFEEALSMNEEMLTDPSKDSKIQLCLRLYHEGTGLIRIVADILP